MGTKMDPVFANLFIGDFERQAINNSPNSPIFGGAILTTSF